MKCYRIYFNRLSEAPQVWSIDEGTQASEINVSAVIVMGCQVASKVNLDETDTDNRPKAWFEVWGWMQVEGGTSVIRGERE